MEQNVSSGISCLLFCHNRIYTIRKQILCFFVFISNLYKMNILHMRYFSVFIITLLIHIYLSRLFSTRRILSIQVLFSMEKLDKILFSTAILIDRCKFVCLLMDEEVLFFIVMVYFLQ